MKAKTKEVFMEEETASEPDIVDLKGTYTNEIPLKEISPNKFNCNVMSKEDYKALKEDMKNTDPHGMSPVVVRQKEDGYEIIDGEHRWKAAKELKWKTIGAIVFPEDKISQDEALVLNFRINRQRGTHDPFKEAAFFEHLTKDQNLTQKKVASLLNIDRSTVNKRLSILRLDKKILKGVGHPTPPPASVLEVVAQAPTEEDQEEVLEEYYDYGSTVQDLKHSVKRMKDDYEKEQAFKKDLEGFKHPNCPTCGKPAKRWSHDKKYVICENYERWSPRTGRTPESYTPTDSRSSQAKKEPEKKVQRVFRSPHTDEQVVKAVRKTLKKALNAFVDQVDYVEFRTDGPHAHGSSKRITFCNSFRSTSLELPTDQGTLHVLMEPKTYKDGNKLKVQVIDPSPTLKEGPKKGQNLFEKMMKDLVTYGKKGKKKRS